MTEETTTGKPDIKLSQLIATALAAITAAFLGSRLGVAGTVIGAGVASIVSTVAGALYQHSLDRTSSRVRSFRTGELDDPAAPTSSTVEETVLIRPPSAPRRRPRWGVAVALTALAFVIGMGAVTGVELIKNGPISGGDNGTTIGSLFGQPTERVTSTPPTTTTPPPPTTTTVPPTTSQTTTPTTTTPPPTSTTAPTTTTAPPSSTTQP
jgi:hypothetical protein